MNTRSTIWTAPNVLSLLAALCGVGILYFAGLRNNPLMGLILLAVGGALCVVDGAVAEAYNQCTKLGDDVLQPVAGLLLSGCSVAALTWRGHWPSPVWMVLAVFGLGLQTVSQFGSRWPRLKRHQFYIHPFFNIGIIVAAMVSFTIISLRWRSPAMLLLEGAAMVFLAAMRHRRIEFWLAGPPPQN